MEEAIVKKYVLTALFFTICFNETFSSAIISKGANSPTHMHKFVSHFEILSLKLYLGCIDG